MGIGQTHALLILLFLFGCSGGSKRAARQKPDGPPIGHWERLPEGPANAAFAGYAVTDREYVAWSWARATAATRVL